MCAGARMSLRRLLTLAMDNAAVRSEPPDRPERQWKTEVTARDAQGKAA